MTKEEILRKNKTWSNIDNLKRYDAYDLEKAVNESMEEYAKQEAIEFNLFNLGDREKYLGRTYEYIWNEYQKSKVK